MEGLKKFLEKVTDSKQRDIIESTIKSVAEMVALKAQGTEVADEDWNFVLGTLKSITAIQKSELKNFIQTSLSELLPERLEAIKRVMQSV